jgi:DNA-binding MarR family transcriptional regulator
LVIAVQNAVEYSDLGVATAGAILFRLIGGAVGTAVLGGIFTTALSQDIAGFAASAGDQVNLGAGGIGPATIAQLPPAMREAYQQAFTAAMNSMFSVASAVALLGFLLSWFLPERPLRRTVAGAAAENAGHSAGHAFAMPADPDSLSVLVRGVVSVAERDVQRRYIAGIAQRAKVDLEPAAVWLLVKVEENGAVRIADLSRRYNVDRMLLERALADLLRRGFVVPRNAGADGHSITTEGCAVFNRLVQARREHLMEIVSEWSPDERQEIGALLRELARRLVPEAREQREAPSRRSL